MGKKQKEVICPICGKVANISKTWTRNKTGKKFSYNVYSHNNGTKHYIRVGRNIMNSPEVFSVYDILKSNIRKIDFNKKLRYTDLKKIVENNKGRKVNNETFSRALKRLINDGIIEKTVSDSKVSYIRKIVTESKYISISKATISIKISDNFTLQGIFYLENKYDEIQDLFFLLGNIGIKSMFQKNQIYALFDKSGPIPAENITAVVSYGEIIMLSVKLNTPLKKNENDYIFLQMKLDSDLDHLELRSWSVMQEVDLNLFLDLVSNNKFNIGISKQLNLGMFEEIPIIRKKIINDKFICISTFFGKIESSEGIYLTLK